MNRAMPKEKKKIKNYSVEDMKQAISAVKCGASVSWASKEYKIPRITLLYKVKGKYDVECRMGPETTLTWDEEKLLVKWLLTIASLEKLNRANKFKNNRPGNKWYKSFLKRHPELSERVTQNLTKGRSEVTEQKLRGWFDEIQQYFTSKNLEDVFEDPRRVYNCDETAFFLAPKGVKCLVQKGDKTPYCFISNDDKECLTCLITANANGEILPPMVVYKTLKRENFALLLKKVIDDTITSEIIKSGFKTCGLFPLNPDSVPYQKYFKLKQIATDIGKVMQPISRKYLQVLEERIGIQKITEFKAAGDMWQGDVCDTSLFTLWRQFSSEVDTSSDMLGAHTELASSNINNSEIIDQRIPDVLIQPVADTHEDVQPILLDKTIPSPFKSTLFWPKLSTPQGRRFKEKIPSVATSEQWRAYYKGKQDERQTKDKEKQERKRLREEARVEKENKKLKKTVKKKPASKRNTKAYESSSDSSIDYVLESEGEGDNWDTFSNSQEEDFEINVNDYVVVKYEDQYYPGNVTEVDTARDEYRVSAMQKSGSGWKWPGRRGIKSAT
ncbi:homeobox-like domain superfamily [Holotrichia oblita]|uniref:Homeobox-like domain superfamily n=1 Tax=Holotrichia oblita TaxID=644536 RepID=A0ACB9TZM4_HOLOL|nr:homeobox-like domain superfamily [Holotrichia oblita]